MNVLEILNSCQSFLANNLNYNATGAKFSQLMTPYSDKFNLKNKFKKKQLFFLLFLLHRIFGTHSLFPSHLTSHESYGTWDQREGIRNILRKWAENQISQPQNWSILLYSWLKKIQFKHISEIFQLWAQGSELIISQQLK